MAAQTDVARGARIALLDAGDIALAREILAGVAEEQRRADEVLSVLPDTADEVIYSLRAAYRALRAGDTPEARRRLSAVDAGQCAWQERLTFELAIAEVAEIMLIPPIMPLPHVPDFILGLINLRGDIVPVVDLRVRFKLNQAPRDTESRIIVMKEDTLQVGVVVDRMWRLLRLPPEAFQPPPSGVAQIDPEYFKEVSDVDDRMLIVLDMHKILKETARKD